MPLRKEKQRKTVQRYLQDFISKAQISLLFLCVIRCEMEGFEEIEEKKFKIYVYKQREVEK